MIVKRVEVRLAHPARSGTGGGAQPKSSPVRLDPGRRGTDGVRCPTCGSMHATASRRRADARGARRGHARCGHHLGAALRSWRTGATTVPACSTVCICPLYFQAAGLRRRALPSDDCATLLAVVLGQRGSRSPGAAMPSCKMATSTQSSFTMERRVTPPRVIVRRVDCRATSEGGGVGSTVAEYATHKGATRFVASGDLCSRHIIIACCAPPNAAPAAAALPGDLCLGRCC